jgi:hypothetical protein
MSYLVAPFCSELEELTYDLVEGAFRQEPSVSIDRLLPFGNHDSPDSRYTWDRSVVGTWPREYCITSALANLTDHSMW